MSQKQPSYLKLNLCCFAAKILADFQKIGHRDPQAIFNVVVTAYPKRLNRNVKLYKYASFIIKTCIFTTLKRILKHNSFSSNQLPIILPRITVRWRCFCAIKTIKFYSTAIFHRTRDQIFSWLTFNEVGLQEEKFIYPSQNILNPKSIDS